MHLRTLACLAAATALFAQVPASRWTFGLHTFGPTFEGHVFDQKDAGNNWDLQRDLGLGKDSSTPGAFIGYEGPRFGFTLAMDGQSYKGAQRLTRDVTVDNTTFRVNTDIRSEMDLKALDLCWTIRVYRWEQAWIGVDLGAHSWSLDLKASGQSQVGTQLQTASAADSISVPIPQIGLSTGGHFAEERGVVKASVHFLGYKGAKYTRISLDARYYVLPWLGLRAFMDNQTFDAPKGSIDTDKEFKLDRNGAGFGIVARW